MAQTKTADFTGVWTSEGDLSAKGRLNMEIEQRGLELFGTASYTDYAGNRQSGVCKISGTVCGSKAAFNIVLNKKTMATGSMVKTGNTIKFVTEPPHYYFPGETHVYKN